MSTTPSANGRAVSTHSGPTTGRPSAPWSEVTIVDGEYMLRFLWDCEDAPELCSLLLWRNLAGWPEQRPYRSIGVEPMVGRAADLSTADPNACAQIGPLGHFRWVLKLSCRRILR